MIISHRHRFIFIKTRKTAGTSIEIALSRYCGPSDVITPITLSDEPYRGQFGYSAQNYLFASDGSDRSPLNSRFKQQILKSTAKTELIRPNSVPYRLRKWVTNFEESNALTHRGYYNHISASNVIQHLGEALWKEYFTFCFEREPIDKVLSDFRYRAPDASFEEYLADFPLPSDFDKYSSHGKLIVDSVGRFENLVEDLTKILAKIGIDYDGWLPRAKATANASNRKSQNLTVRQEAQIRAEFGREYEHFPYF